MSEAPIHWLMNLTAEQQEVFDRAMAQWDQLTSEEKRTVMARVVQRIKEGRLGCTPDTAILHEDNDWDERGQR